MFRGDTKKLDLTIRIGETPENLASGQLFMTAADQSGTVVFSKSVGLGIVLTNAANGQATITIDPQDTQSLPGRITRLKYDVEYENGAGEIYTILSGTITVQPDVTVR